MDTITAGALASGLLELVKFLARKYAVKDMTYDFPIWSYAVVLALFNAVMPFVMVYGLGMPTADPILTMSGIGIAQYLLRVAIGALISVGTNTLVIKPTKTYIKNFDLTNN